MSAKLSFTDAMIFALWLVWDERARGEVAAAVFVLATVVMWLMTVAVCAVFAAKHCWWVRRRVRQEAEHIAAMSDGVSVDHATDLLTCPGPCANPYGCMVGVCVLAAVRRMDEESARSLMADPYEKAGREHMAGRHLDREVIEALGWECLDGLADRQWHRNAGPFDPSQPQFLAIDAMLCRRVSANKWDDFHPSENIADAFQVVEAMRARQPRGPMSVLFGFDHQRGEWRCEFLAPDDQDWSVWGESLPLVICLAALKALAAHFPEKASVDPSPTPSDQ